MYVKSVDLNDLLDAYECRQAIETTAVRILSSSVTKEKVEELTAYFKPFLNSKKIDKEKYLKADSDFHRKLVQMTGNAYLISMNRIANVFNQTYRQGLIREPRETLSEHLLILSAMETGDAGLAEEYMRNHIRKSILKIRHKLSANY